MEVIAKPHTPAALAPGKDPNPQTLNMRLHWRHIRSARVEEEILKYKNKTEFHVRDPCSFWRQKARNPLIILAPREKQF